MGTPIDRLFSGRVVLGGRRPIRYSLRRILQWKGAAFSEGAEIIERAFSFLMALKDKGMNYL